MRSPLGMALLLVLLGMARATFGAAEDDVAFIRVAAVETANRVKTFRCKCVSVVEKIGGRRISMDEFLYKYKNGKAFLERVKHEGEQPSSWTRKSWDGRKLRHYRSATDVTPLGEQGTIWPERGNGWELFDRTPMGLWRDQILETAADADLRLGDAGQSASGLKLLEVFIKKTPNAPATETMLSERSWFDSQRDYALVKYQAFLNDGTIWCTYDYELEKSGDVYFPTTIVRRFKDSTETLTISDVAINAEIDDKEFVEIFPPGIDIFDGVTGEKYDINDSDSPGIDIFDNESGKKAGYKRATEPSAATTPAPSTSKSSSTDAELEKIARNYEPDQRKNGGGKPWAWFLAGGAVVAFAVTVGLSRRRRRQR